MEAGGGSVKMQPPGHESNDQHTYWAKLAPDSLDRIVAEARRLLAELFRS